MDFQETKHASIVIEERGISREWIEQVLKAPERKKEDSRDVELEHRLGRIEEYGNRVLRVIINVHTNPPKIVTAYFDRTVKGDL